MDKLQHMMDSFATNQHQHYRAQMQAIQTDMSLILRAEPYEGLPLDDSAEEIRAAVESVGAGVGLEDEAAQKDFLSMAGSRYRAFVKDVNDAIEQRDADLTVLHNRYDQSIAELERTTQQKLHQAEEEHKALSNTIRQRLITTITKRKQQLLRDKEQLDIAESNAALLHPSQFTLTVPGSPGGGPNRKTRHLRHRNTSPGDEASKRKRKAAAMDDEGNESPGPGFRAPPPDNLGGGRSPFKDAREKNTYTQYEAPAYSLERIFTDKELALATDTARMATYRYFHQPRTMTTDNLGNGATGPLAADEALGENEDAVDGLDGTNGTPPPAALDMERSASHQVLTRGHARANPLAALSDLATAAAASSGGGSNSALRDNPFAPVVPTFHAVTRSEKTGAPTPPMVSQLDLENDFEMMRRSGYEAALDASTGTYTQAAEARANAAAYEMRQSLLDQALNGPSSASQPFRLQLLNQGAASIGKGVDRLPTTGYAPLNAAGVLEQRLRAQTNGGSLASALRGEPMSRATSAAGSEVGDGGSGRGRRRAAV